MSRSIDAYGGQTGGGINDSDAEVDVHLDSDSDESDDQEDEHVDSDSDISDDEELGTMEDEVVDDGDNENWVFDSIIKQTKEALGEDANIKEIRKLFRQKFGDSLDWYHNLRKHHIYKKIMATAKDLQDGPGDYDRIEAMRAAIKQRSFLLDGLVSSPDSDDDVDASGI